jgi:hypothetical protein
MRRVIAIGMAVAWLTTVAQLASGLTGFSVDPGRPGTYGYGFGAGVQLPKATRPPFSPDEEELIEIGVRYIRGGGVRLDRDRFAPRTHAVMVHVGWGFRAKARQSTPKQ